MIVRRLIRFTPAILAVTAGALLMAGCHRRHCGWHSSPEEKADKVAGHIARELDLNADQKSRLDAIKADILTRKADFSSLREGFREEALAQIRAGAVDTEALNRSLAAREEKARELRGFLVAKFAEFHAVLDTAQREKLASRVEKHWKGCR